jgi:ribonuclease-3
MDKLRELEQKIGYRFKNFDLLIESMTHKSCKQPYSNERLEYLGDAVLDLIVGEYLFHKFPKNAEGELSKLRASLVNEDSFAKLARELDLGAFIFISPAEEKNGGRDKPSLLSDAFEALVGALYLETGLERARELIHELLEKSYENISLKNIFKDYKTTLQEVTQASFGGTPIYEVISSSGPDHQKSFEIAVMIDGKEYGKAMGRSKKEAQQKAAKIALDKLQA